MRSHFDTDYKSDYYKACAFGSTAACFHIKADFKYLGKGNK